MKKIPSLFNRIFHEHNVRETLNEVKEGLEWVLKGEGVATVKYDGSCTAVINGEFYRRYDAKHGKPIPDGAIKCQEEADPVTGHLPCWLKVSKENPGDKWLLEAYKDYLNNHDGKIANGTYEAIGLHFQSNPYNLSHPHPCSLISVSCSLTPAPCSLFISCTPSASASFPRRPRCRSEIRRYIF